MKQIIPYLMILSLFLFGCGSDDEESDAGTPKMPDIGKTLKDVNDAQEQAEQRRKEAEERGRKQREAWEKEKKEREAESLALDQKQREENEKRQTLAEERRKGSDQESNDKVEDLKKQITDQLAILSSGSDTSISIPRLEMPRDFTAYGTMKPLVLDFSGKEAANGLPSGKWQSLVLLKNIKNYESEFINVKDNRGNALECKLIDVYGETVSSLFVENKDGKIMKLDMRHINPTELPKIHFWMRKQFEAKEKAGFIEYKPHPIREIMKSMKVSKANDLTRMKDLVEKIDYGDATRLLDSDWKEKYLQLNKLRDSDYRLYDRNTKKRFTGIVRQYALAQFQTNGSVYGRFLKGEYDSPEEFTQEMKTKWQGVYRASGGYHIGVSLKSETVYNNGTKVYSLEYSPSGVPEKETEFALDGKFAKENGVAREWPFLGTIREYKKANILGTGIDAKYKDNLLENICWELNGKEEGKKITFASINYKVFGKSQVRAVNNYSMGKFHGMQTSYFISKKAFEGPQDTVGEWNNGNKVWYKRYLNNSDKHYLWWENKYHEGIEVSSVGYRENGNKETETEWEVTDVKSGSKRRVRRASYYPNGALEEERTPGAFGSPDVVKEYNEDGTPKKN